MSLNENLEALRAGMTSQGVAAFEEVMRRIDPNLLAEAALKRGDPMPSFELPNTEGKLVSSVELLRHGGLVVTFYRGSWCPYCMTTLQALDLTLTPVLHRKAALVALSPETGGRAGLVKNKYNLRYQLLTDVDNAVAAQFGVLVRLPPLYRELLLSCGIEAETLHGGKGWFIPTPSTFVVDSDGIVAHVQIHVDYTRRTELETLPSVLCALRQID
jgi:peroxiredoxin